MKIRKPQAVAAFMLASFALSLGGLAPSTSAHPAASVLTTTVLVQGASYASMTTDIRAVGGSVGPALPIISGVVAHVPTSALPALTRRDQVSPNTRFTLTGSLGENSADASAVFPSSVQAPAVWAQGNQGQGATIAILDTGISNVGDLAGRVIGGVDLTGEGDYTHDGYGHGTFVAGLAAGNGNDSQGAVTGVAPQANLVSVKVAGADGVTDLIHVLLGLQWVASFQDQYNIRVLNLSLGSPVVQAWNVDPVDAAVEKVWRSGVLVTVSAGNTSAVTSPGNDPYVITVGSVDDHTTAATSDDTLSAFSAQTGSKPDVLAPGQHVVATKSPGSASDLAHPDSSILSSYMRGSGTSFSSAVVAGEAALLFTQNPHLTPDQAKAQIVNNTAPGTPGPGEVSVSAALAAKVGPSANKGLHPSSGKGSLFMDMCSCTDVNAFIQAHPDSAPWANNSPASSSWLSSSWLSSSWLSADWNSSSWLSSSWLSSSWLSSSWLSSSWMSSSWLSSSWLSSSWQ